MSVAIAFLTLAALGVPCLSSNIDGTCAKEPCHSEGGSTQDEVDMLQVSMQQPKNSEVGRHEELPGTIKSFKGNVESDGLCQAEGIWEDHEGGIAFFATENVTKLAIEGFPSLTVIYDKTPKLIRVEVGDASMTPQKGVEDPADVRAALMLLSTSSVAAGRGKRLSQHLAMKGWNGGARPCTYKLHMLLNSLSKAKAKAQFIEKANSAGKWGPYSTPNSLCPRNKEATWECQQTYWWGSDSAWVPPGSDVLKGAYDSVTKDNKCRDLTGSDPECHGLCGATCDCWESICGSDYLCEYNPVCCAHDYACDKGMLTSECMDSFVMSACSNEGLKEWGPQ